jgi:hypothetical protein
MFQGNAGYFPGGTEETETGQLGHSSHAFLVRDMLFSMFSQVWDTMERNKNDPKLQTTTTGNLSKWKPHEETTHSNCFSILRIGLIF